MNANEKYSQRLSDEEMADLLASPFARREAMTDAEDAELANLRSALASYRTETLAWAERRSATQPSLVAAARRSGVWAAASQWSLAAVAVLTVSAGVALFSSHQSVNERASGSAPIAITATAASSQSEIAADNEMLSSIDSALSYHQSTPVDAFELNSAHGSTRRVERTEVTD